MERVVLLDESGRAIGTTDKAGVHHASTPLHLAFSCYLFDASDRLLVSQRALTKKTWPGVWTNSACGHPAPGEVLHEGVRRRVGDELGVHLSELVLVLPQFRYRAVMSNGVTENEMCPVFMARTADEPVIDPSEVETSEWVDWTAFSDDVLTGRRAVSPWCVEQVTQLVRLGPDPSAWRGDPDLLPSAARPAA